MNNDNTAFVPDLCVSTKLFSLVCKRKRLVVVVFAFLDAVELPVTLASSRKVSQNFVKIGEPAGYLLKFLLSRARNRRSFVYFPHPRCGVHLHFDVGISTRINTIRLEFYFRISPSSETPEIIQKSKKGKALFFTVEQAVSRHDSHLLISCSFWEKEELPIKKIPFCRL